MAQVYWEILKYRKLSPGTTRDSKYPTINKLHKSSGTGWLFILTGLFMIFFNLLCPYYCNVDPERSTALVNAIYFGFSRPLWTFGVFCICIAIFTG